MRKQLSAYAKTKMQISFAVTAKLISAFVFATWIVQYLFYLNQKFQASCYIQLSCSPVCVGPGRKPRRPVFSQGNSYQPSLIILNCLHEDALNLITQEAHSKDCNQTGCLSAYYYISVSGFSLKT